MKEHMNRETVKSYSEALLNVLRTEHSYTLEQVRRVCIDVVRRIGSLKDAKIKDLETATE